MTPPEEHLHGSCLCGGIAFHAALPATDPGHCYCTMCQKFHGAAAGSYAGVARAGFVLERGSALLVEYASSEQGRRGFCKVCGSSLYWRSEATLDVIDVALGTLQPPWTASCMSTISRRGRRTGKEDTAMPLFDSLDDVVRGACLCGGIAYHAAGPLFATSHCYCTMCQRQHGGAAGSYGNVRADGFVVDRGQELVTHYQRSPAGRCAFCSRCGAMLYWRGTDTPERIALALGCLAPAWTGTVEREWFTEHKPDWLPPA